MVQSAAKKNERLLLQDSAPKYPVGKTCYANKEKIAWTNIQGNQDDYFDEYC